MKITIEYESSWRNSFINGSNNEPMPKNGRKFIGSMTNLKQAENFIQRKVTLDTVMGVLNRLIGDQRKLYQARNDGSYFFKDIEPCIDYKDNVSVMNNEMTYIRNITGNTDPKSYSGIIKNKDIAFTSDYSCEFWGVLFLDLNELCYFIKGDNHRNAFVLDYVDPLDIVSRIETIEKIKPALNEGLLSEAYEHLKDKYSDYDGLNKKELIIVKRLYFSALYIQLERVSSKYDITSLLAKRGGITGISKNNFTKKNFMGRFTTGGEKKVWGNPYIHEEFIKGGKAKHLMSKASGTLEIIIDVSRNKAEEIKNMIENAGVSSFYLGKKGLAYVSNISTREVRK